MYTVYVMHAYGSNSDFANVLDAHIRARPELDVFVNGAGSVSNHLYCVGRADHVVALIDVKLMLDLRGNPNPTPRERTDLEALVAMLTKVNAEKRMTTVLMRDVTLTKTPFERDGRADIDIDFTLRTYDKVACEIVAKLLLVARDQPQGQRPRVLSDQPTKTSPRRKTKRNA